MFVCLQLIKVNSKVSCGSGMTLLNTSLNGHIGVSLSLDDLYAFLNVMIVYPTMIDLETI